jgi:hypothetical protein
MFLSFLAIVPTYALAQDEIALFNGHHGCPVKVMLLFRNRHKTSGL